MTQMNSSISKTRMLDPTPKQLIEMPAEAASQQHCSIINIVITWLKQVLVVLLNNIIETRIDDHCSCVITIALFRQQTCNQWHQQGGGKDQLFARTVFEKHVAGGLLLMLAK